MTKKVSDSCPHNVSHTCFHNLQKLNFFLLLHTRACYGYLIDFLLHFSLQTRIEYAIKCNFLKLNTTLLISVINAFVYNVCLVCTEFMRSCYLYIAYVNML